MFKNKLSVVDYMYFVTFFNKKFKNKLISIKNNNIKKFNNLLNNTKDQYSNNTTVHKCIFNFMDFELLPEVETTLSLEPRHGIPLRPNKVAICTIIKD